MRHTVEDFRDWLERRGRGRSAAVYGRVARRWLDDPKTVEALLAGSGGPRKAPKTRHVMAAGVRAWARYTGDGELLLRLEDLKLPAPITRDAREPFELEAWKNLLQCLEEADWLDDALQGVCLLIAIRGIRAGDVLRLQKREVDRALKTGILAYEGKGERRNEYTAAPLKPYLEILAGEWWGRGDKKQVWELVATSEPAAGRAVRRAFDRLAVECDLDPEEVYAHRFRHTYATHFLRGLKKDPEGVFKLKAQMGWAKLETAMNYVQAPRQELLDEVESRLLDQVRSKSKGK